MNQNVQILGSESQAEIISIRKEAFRLKYGLSVDTSGLEWNQTDSRSTHVGIFSQSRLVSVLRITHMTTAEEFQRVMLFPPDHPFSSWPCFALARAATLSSHASQSLNLSLRLAALHFIRENARPPTEFIFGTALADSKRFKLLEYLGYEFLIHSDPWKGFLQSTDKPVAIFRLSLQDLNLAIHRLQLIIQEMRIGLINDFQDSKLDL